MPGVLELEVEIEAIYLKQQILLQSYYEDIRIIISFDQAFLTKLEECFEQCSIDLRKEYKQFLKKFKNHVLERKFLSPKEFSFYCSRTIGGEFALTLATSREKHESTLWTFLDDYLVENDRDRSCC